jgi:hypothetical protein
VVNFLTYKDGVHNQVEVGGFTIRLVIIAVFIFVALSYSDYIIEFFQWCVSQYNEYGDVFDTVTAKFDKLKSLASNYVDLSVFDDGFQVEDVQSMFADYNKSLEKFYSSGEIALEKFANYF